MHNSAHSRFSQVGKLLFALALAATTLVVASAPAVAHTPHDSISEVVLSPNFGQDGKVYVITSSRLLVSDNGAWRTLQRGLPRAPEHEQSIARMAIAPSSPNTMYVSSRKGGVFRSTDGGASWQAAARGLDPADMSVIAVSPSDPDVVLAGGTITGLFRTVDGAQQWKSVEGFGRVPALAFGPSGRIFAGGADGRLSVSNDNGATWKVATRFSGNGAISAIATSSAEPSNTVFVGTGSGAVFRSDDGGDSFEPVETDLPRDSVASLVMSPAFARDRTMWVSMTKTGVYRSRDGGETWERASEGLTTDPQADEVKVSQFRRISVAANAGGKNVLFAAGFDGLFRSDDEAARWVSVETLADYVVGLSVSPDFEHDSTIAVATYVKGAYLSTQDGATWHRIDNGLRHELSEGNEFAPIRRLHNITFSPDYAQDRTIFSASWTAFLRSTDSGDNWETIRVNPESPASELQQFVLGVSPAYSSDHTLYLGTRVGDLYRSASRGDAGSWTHLGSLGARVRPFLRHPAGHVRRNRRRCAEERRRRGHLALGHEWTGGRNSNCAITRLQKRSHSLCRHGARPLRVARRRRDVAANRHASVSQRRNHRSGRVVA
jgi:photosystem II stability/assembly factor-like uncharacterized protein